MVNYVQSDQIVYSCLCGHFLARINGKVDQTFYTDSIKKSLYAKLLQAKDSNSCENVTQKLQSNVNETSQ